MNSCPPFSATLVEMAFCSSVPVQYSTRTMVPILRELLLILFQMRLGLMLLSKCMILLCSAKAPYNCSLLHVQLQRESCTPLQK